MSSFAGGWLWLLFLEAKLFAAAPLWGCGPRSCCVNTRIPERCGPETRGTWLETWEGRSLSMGELILLQTTLSQEAARFLWPATHHSPKSRRNLFGFRSMPTNTFQICSAVFLFKNFLALATNWVKCKPLQLNRYQEYLGVFCVNPLRKGQRTPTAFTWLYLQ